MRHKSITVFFLFVSLLTFTLGCWQLYRLSWKNDLIDNINSSITNPELFYQEIIDCEYCCRPNRISLEIKNESIIRIDISDGNE